MRIEEVIGERIREVRDLQELTQEQFGQRLGELLGRAWSRQAVSSAEQGGRQFTAAELVAIAHVLNTTVPRLMTPPLTAREIELPSGATIDRTVVADRVFPKASAAKVFDAASDNLRVLTQAIVGQHEYYKTMIDVLDVLHTNFAMTTDARLAEAEDHGRR